MPLKKEACHRSQLPILFIGNILLQLLMLRSFCAGLFLRASTLLQKAHSCKLLFASRDSSTLSARQYLRASVSPFNAVIIIITLPSSLSRRLQWLMCPHQQPHNLKFMVKRKYYYCCNIVLQCHVAGYCM